MYASPIATVDTPISDEELMRVVATIVRDSKPVHERYTDGSEMAFELSTNLATARG